MVARCGPAGKTAQPVDTLPTRPLYSRHSWRTVPVPGAQRNLLTGQRMEGGLILAPCGVAFLTREA